jgi:UDP-glucuronate 4-epimerase
MRVMVTGSAGFIGFHLAARLLAAGHEVVGVDGLTPYYDVSLKEARHALLKAHDGFREEILMLEDNDALTAVARARPPEMIVHLAAQAGVRYSLENPRAYVDSNLEGTFNVMEVARTTATPHLMLASTSSVYGSNQVMPFVETERADHPLTLYAATKKATEQMTHSYSHLWNLPTTVFRFFSVYGPWGRPDMALFKFAQGILRDEPIDVYNGGEMERDFTYVDDLVEAIVRLSATPPRRGEPVAGAVDSLSPVAPWRVVNIGKGEPVKLMDFIAEIEKGLGRKAILNMMPMQPGDVPRTFADATLLQALTGYRPTTAVSAGVAAFCSWYRSYHGL